MARPNTVRRKPRPNTRKSTNAFVLTVGATSPLRPPDSNVRYWTPVITAPSGRKIRPMPRNRRRGEKYIRLDAATMQPQGRRRPTRSGVEGRHVVLETSQIRKARMTPHTIRKGDGFPASAVSRLDPVPTTPQKNPVAVPPARVPIGTVKLLSRQSLFAHVIGCVHCGFVLGPVGPL